MVCSATWIMYCETQAPWRIYDNDDTRYCIMSINLKKGKKIHAWTTASIAKQNICIFFIQSSHAKIWLVFFHFRILKKIFLSNRFSRLNFFNNVLLKECWILSKQLSKTIIILEIHLRNIRKFTNNLNCF